MATKPETQFRKKVRSDLTKLAQLGGPIFFEAIQQRAIKGSPDYILCVRGHFIALELKAPGGSISPIQEAKLNAIGRASGTAFLVEPSGWAEVYGVISALMVEEEETGKRNYQ